MGVKIELIGDEYDLELAVLRESVAAIDVGRQRCTCCGRMPLVGEFVFRSLEQVDCELCRAVRRDAPPAAVEQVRHAGGHLTVQASQPRVISAPKRADLAHG
jgi:hypothetical protein